MPYAKTDSPIFIRQRKYCGERKDFHRMVANFRLTSFRENGIFYVLYLDFISNVLYRTLGASIDRARFVVQNN